MPAHAPDVGASDGHSQQSRKRSLLLRETDRESVSVSIVYSQSLVQLKALA